MFTWIDKLFSLVESKLSCPHCKDITWSNICTRVCIPWGSIQCSQCGKDISGSIGRGFIQVFFSAVIMCLTAITVPSSEIYYPRSILSRGLGSYAVLGYIFVVVFGIGKCDL